MKRLALRLRFAWLRLRLWLADLDVAGSEFEPSLNDQFRAERLRVLDSLDAVAMELGL